MTIVPAQCLLWLLGAFARAIAEGDRQGLFDMLAADATLVVDAGPGGRRLGRIRSAGRPVVGARRIAALLAAAAREGLGGAFIELELNGQPAIVRIVDGRPASATLLSVVDGKITHAFVQTDANRLTHLGPALAAAS